MPGHRIDMISRIPRSNGSTEPAYIIYGLRFLFSASDDAMSPSQLAAPLFRRQRYAGHHAKADVFITIADRASTRAARRHAA